MGSVNFMRVNLFLPFLWWLNFYLLMGPIGLLVNATIQVDNELSRSTCEYSDVSNLLAIVNQSSTNRLNSVLNDKTSIGPKLNVVIISPFPSDEKKEGSDTIYVDQRRNYSTFAFAINEFYAQYNNYYYVINQTVDDNARSFNWNAISQIRNALHTWGKKMDFIVFATLDSIFVNFDLRFEQLLNKNKKTNVIFLSGGAMTGAKISTDLIIVRNNIWTLDFFDDLWTTRDRNQFSEVQVVDELFKLYEDDLKDHILIISNNVFRNDYPAMSRFRSAHNMLSFPLEVSEYKRNVFEEVFEMICTFEKKSHSPYGGRGGGGSGSGSGESVFPLQRSITLDMLKMHSVETYRALWDDKLAEYTIKAAHGDNTPFETDRLSTITVYLSNTISLFKPSSSEKSSSSPSSAIDSSFEPIHSELTEAHNESIKILSKTFKQMFLNLKKYRLKLSETPLKALEYLKIDSQYPNILKAVLRLGQEYMSHIKQNPKELTVLTEILRDILEDLFVINPKDIETQESLVYMDVDLGMEHMANQRYQQALSDFLSALRVARKVGNYIGDHIVLSPANQAAEAMVMLERYEEATVLYDTVVPLTKKHNGADDLTSGFIYIQAAFAYHQFQRHKTAHGLIEKAIEILEMNGIDQSDPKVYQHAKEIEKNTRGRRDEDDEAANRDYGF